MPESASGGCLLQGGVCSGGSAPGWGVSVRGVSALGGVCSRVGGVCSWGLLPWGVSAWGVSAQGVSAPGGVCSWGGVSAGGGWGCVVSQHAPRQTPPVNRMTNRCKNITLATTSLRPVKMSKDTRFCLDRLE